MRDTPLLDRFRKMKEPYRMLLIGGMTIAVCIVGAIVPAISAVLWTVFLGFGALLMYLDLREPVNYISLEFDDRGFRHEGIGGIVEADWSDVRDVSYGRFYEPFANHIETEWCFELKSGETIRVLVEWPHRRAFARAVVQNLAIVSPELVGNARRMRGEGRWSCVDMTALLSPRTTPAASHPDRQRT